MSGLVAAIALYAAVSLLVPRPYPTPLDFREATAPSYLLLQVAVGVLVLAMAGPIPDLAPAGLAWGYAAGLAFVTAPHLLGIARGECVHQFEVADLHPPKLVAPREALLCAVVFPAIAASEEVVFRGVVRLPEPLVVVGQWLVYRAGSRTAPAFSAVACVLLGALHQATGSLGAVIGAHAAIQTLTGWLRAPGLFGGVYPLLEQAKWRNLAPAWQQAALGLAAGAGLLVLLR
jgi:membrane protease YdiL (CAAX protease family)